jgi:hypothetical protein
MKKPVVSLLLLPLLVALASCGNYGKEKLTPFVNPMTVNELRNDQAIKFSYKIDQTQIDEYARGTKKFPIFGRLFQAIAFVLANTSINSKGGHELELDPVDLDLNSLGDIDFDMIDWISLDSLLVQVDKATKKDSLEFIERIEIMVHLNNPVEGLAVDKKGFSRLVYYDKKVHKLGCDGKCLNLRIERVKWKELIRLNPHVTLQPKIIVNSVPKSTMALAGAVDFSIKFNLGF